MPASPDRPNPGPAVAIEGGNAADGATTLAARASALGWIDSHVAKLESLQADLERTLESKRDALAAGEVEQIEAVVIRETEQVRRLEELRRSRDRWLASAPLTQQVHSLGEAARIAEASPDLLARIETVREQARTIQKQNWTHWVIAQRSAAHFEEMLGLIARRGETSPTYGGDDPQHGGGLLDAAA